MAHKPSDTEFIALVEEGSSRSTKLIDDEIHLLVEKSLERSFSSIDRTLRVVQEEAFLLQSMSHRFKEAALQAARDVDELRAMCSRIENTKVPVSRLPNELLIEIIRMAAFQERTSPHELVPFISTCHHWKDVLFGTPTLWATIAYRDEKDRSPGLLSTNHFIEKNLEIFSTFLQRSGVALLDVSISFRASTIPQQQRLHGLLAPHITRCKSIHFGGDPQGLSFFFPIHQSPSLLRLEISSWGDSWVRPLAFFAPGAGHTLRTFSCSLYRSDGTSIDGGQITSLELTNPGDEMFALVNRCSVLERLRIRFRHEFGSSWGWGLETCPTIEIPSLRSLTVCGSPHPLLPVIADNLLHLILDDDGGICGDLEASCSTSLPIPFPSLRSMEVHKYFESPLVFGSIISTHPDLTGLHLCLDRFFEQYPPLLIQFLQPWNQGFQMGDHRRRYLRVHAYIDGRHGKTLAAEQVLSPLIVLLEEIAPLYLQVITLSGDLDSVAVPERFRARVEIAKHFPQSVAEVADWVNVGDIMAS